MKIYEWQKVLILASKINRSILYFFYWTSLMLHSSIQSKNKMFFLIAGWDQDYPDQTEFSLFCILP